MIILDYRDTRPLYEQIVDKFQMLILSGALEPNSRMPSVRSLAVELEKLRDLKKEALSMGMTVKELTEFLEQEDTAAAGQKETKAPAAE